MGVSARLAGFVTFVAVVALASTASFAGAAADDGGVTPVARPGSELASEKRVGRRDLKRTLRRYMRSVGGASGAYVADTDANRKRRLFSDSGSAARILASNSKLFTTAAYLGRFGPDHRLGTSVFERGERKGARERGLDGSLVLVGDGDPALAEPSFASAMGLPLTSLNPLARAVKDAGIRRVHGNVLASPSIFDGRGSVPTTGVDASLGDLPTLSGLSFNRGMEDWRYAEDPARNAGEELKRELRDRGVRVTGRVRVGKAPGRVLSSEPLGTVASPPARSLISRTNTPSDNFYAEMLLKRLGAGGERRGTTARGAKRAERFAKKAGSGVRLENGSGLTRSNRASPHDVARLLAYMRNDGHGLKRAFYDSLAVAGRTGTLASRMRGTAAQGRCVGKTGTISGVSALSGYCRAGKGTVVYSILMNNVSVDAARRAQDGMVAAIARHR